MSKKRPLTTEEQSMAAKMSAAIANSPDLTEESVGVAVGVTQGQVSHWTRGRLPVPARRALKLASILGIDDPGEISLAYRELASQASVGDERRPDLVIARLENDVDALRYALGTLVAVMGVHRPAEGVDVAEALRKHVPEKFVRRGYIHELLEVLDKAQVSRSAKARRAAKPES